MWLLFLQRSRRQLVSNFVSTKPRIMGRSQRIWNLNWFPEHLYKSYNKLDSKKSESLLIWDPRLQWIAKKCIQEFQRARRNRKLCRTDSFSELYKLSIFKLYSVKPSMHLQPKLPIMIILLLSPQDSTNHSSTCSLINM